jgi:hypothetical protein
VWIECAITRLLDLIQRFSKVGIWVVDKSVNECNVVVWVAFDHQNFGERCSQNTTIAIVSGAVKEVCEQSHDTLERTLVLKRQAADDSFEGLIEVGWK